MLRLPTCTHSFDRFVGFRFARHERHTVRRRASLSMAPRVGPIFLSATNYRPTASSKQASSSTFHTAASRMTMMQTSSARPIPIRFQRPPRRRTQSLAMVTMKARDLEGLALRPRLRRTPRRPIDIVFVAAGRPPSAEQASCSRRLSRRGSHQTPIVSACCSYWTRQKYRPWRGASLHVSRLRTESVQTFRACGFVKTTSRSRNFQNEIEQLC